MAARKTILGFVAAPCALPGAKRSGRAASRLARACDQRLTLCARRRPCLCACLLAATFGEVSELAKLNVVLKKTSHHYHAELLYSELNLVVLHIELEKVAATADLRGHGAAAWPLARQQRGSAPASAEGAPTTGRAESMNGGHRCGLSVAVPVVCEGALARATVKTEECLARAATRVENECTHIPHSPCKSSHPWPFYFVCVILTRSSSLPICGKEHVT